MQLLNDRRFIGLLIALGAGCAGLLLPHGKHKSLGDRSEKTPGDAIASLPLPPAFRAAAWETVMDHNPFESHAVADDTPIISPPPAPAVSLPDLRVTAVLLGETPWAIINGKAVRVNDEIGPARVVAIEHSGVVLLVNDGLLVISTSRADANGVGRDQ